ncbi:MAG: hypothetical protein ACREBC_38360, partial [Pyrinomonadaceae bacterium]
ELAQELIYCNRCGANLKPISNHSGVPPAKLVGAAWAISVAVALVTLGGFAMVFGIVLAFVARGLSLSGGGTVLTVLSSLIILAIDWLLLRQLSRVLDMNRLSNDAQRRTPKLGEMALPQIGEPREPASSVTEHTTRNFEAMDGARGQR